MRTLASAAVGQTHQFERVPVGSFGADDADLLLDSTPAFRVLLCLRRCFNALKTPKGSGSYSYVIYRLKGHQACW